MALLLVAMIAICGTWHAKALPLHGTFAWCLCFKRAVLCVLACLAGFPPLHSYADLLEIRLQYTPMAFSRSLTLRHLTSTRLPEESQSDYNTAELFTMGRACTHKRLKLDLFKQEDILVINMSLLFCSLSIITRIGRLFYSLDTFLLKFALQSPKQFL